MLSRTYAAHRIENQINETAFELIPESTAFPFDFWNTIQIGVKHTWFDDYVYERLSQYKEGDLRKLDIWDREFISYYNLKDERNILEKLLHKYLYVSQIYSNSLLIRVIDKVLKKIV